VNSLLTSLCFLFPASCFHVLLYKSIAALCRLLSLSSFAFFLPSSPDHVFSRAHASQSSKTETHLSVSSGS
jgi:hypothetical protein